MSTRNPSEEELRSAQLKAARLAGFSAGRVFLLLFLFILLGLFILSRSSN